MATRKTTTQSTPTSSEADSGGRLAAVTAAVQTAYDRVLRPALPRKLGVFNGVVARGDRLLDATDTHPEYEAGIVNSLRDFVTEGDSVVIVGGGIGVSSVVAANQTGETGTVTTFEASATHANDIVPETIRINDPAATVGVWHAVVGTAVSTRGALAGARQIAASELPACDVLELDCEGAELEILRGLPMRPQILIVESHGCYDAPTSEVRAVLDDLGYRLLRIEPEVPEKDVMVLTAVRTTATETNDE